MATSRAVEENITALLKHPRLLPATSGLCCLPQELRDLIFHELWELAPVIRLSQNSFINTSVSITLSYGSRKTDQLYSVPGLPEWLLTSKAFLQEGLRQLFRHATWEWYNDHHSNLSNHVSYRNPLAGISVATNFVILDHAFLHNRRARTDPASETLQNKRQPAELIAPLLSSKLQVLDMNLRVQMHHRDTFVLNLARFGSPNLRLAKLVVCLRLKLAALSASLHEHDVAYAAFLAQAESEVTELGKAWIGEKSTMQLEETISWFSGIHTRHEQAYARGLPAKDSRRHHMTFTIVRNED